MIHFCYLLDRELAGHKHQEKFLVLPQKLMLPNFLRAANPNMFALISLLFLMWKTKKKKCKV